MCSWEGRDLHPRPINYRVLVVRLLVLRSSKHIGALSAQPCVAQPCGVVIFVLPVSPTGEKGIRPVTAIQMQRNIVRVGIQPGWLWRHLDCESLAGELFICLIGSLSLSLA